ncbi:MAG: N-methyl-D-aspartate receptor NMDAR2C subunit [Parcubacteria group bacterium Gr01-1014_19]|nr:MAG: N-methyl-D-aspartate receptor NMDAR2C subunit [Parcubacteria group bacterium Gr01-1014_19]
MQNKSRQLWREMWRRLSSPGGLTEICEDYALLRLVAEYCQPRRFYHTTDHIEHCIAEFDEARHLAANPTEVEFALWFHDAVYDPMKKDNEEQSVLFALEIGRECGVSEDFLQRVGALIMETKHSSIPDNDDGQLIVDIDLAILGQPDEAFDKYEENIRKEYSFVPEDVFKVRQAEILQSFLDRPSIYYIEFFRQKYEAQARRNLQRSIQKLKSPG